ncbi:MAG: YHS domain-containing (seleno)protein [Planctomycetota bacterium]
MKLNPLKLLVAAALSASVAAASVGITATQPADDDTFGTYTERASHLGKYELPRSKLAIDGYDPVAYFPEGDPDGKGDAIKGKKNLEYTHHGISYRFSSQANLDLFKANPAKYEPAYGGWCAYAASKDSYTEPSPKNFKIENGRLLLFFKGLFGDTLKDWNNEGPATLAPQADAFWKAETGEEPRVIE